MAHLRTTREVATPVVPSTGKEVRLDPDYDDAIQQQKVLPFFRFPLSSAHHRSSRNQYQLNAQHACTPSIARCQLTGDTNHILLLGHFAL